MRVITSAVGKSVRSFNVRKLKLNCVGIFDLIKFPSSGQLGRAPNRTKETLIKRASQNLPLSGFVEVAVRLQGAREFDLM